MVDRWYVTLFLVTFLVLAGRRWGSARTLLWLASGYLIALGSEALSIRVGIPYGLYAYHYDQLTTDPLLFGVPVWDSLSYPFMIYAGFSLAEHRLATARSWGVALAGACATMFLDVIVDPVSHRGNEWFLGQIYDYVHPGPYFGIPLSNFAGWFLVPWVVIITNQRLWRLPVLCRRRPQAPPHGCDVLFYLGIAGFGIGIACAIQAWTLALASTSILAATLFGLQHAARWHTTRRHDAVPTRSWRAHRGRPAGRSSSRHV
ncbi:MAG: carotenoid biosynthesis protein [Deltaproteobacteria bacterium]|nr:carotenoid biosynthesis protein [Deltaproteobacteria bacterium]